MKSFRECGIFMKSYFNYKAVIACCVLASLFLFSNLDKKICEIFLASRKINANVENVLLVKGITSAESEFAGAREKIAESVLMLNELGADKIIFDFDLSKKCSDNLFFDADAYLENCLKVKNNVVTTSEISDGAGPMFDYKNVNRVDAAVIESVKDKIDESSSIDCDVFYEIRIKENTLVKSISEFEDDGYFEYTPEYNSPYAASVDFVRRKEILFDTLDGENKDRQKAFDEYVEAKQHFVDSVLMYLEGSAKELLSENADERKSGYGNIEERFSKLEKCFNEYSEERDNVKEKISGSTCVFAPDDTVYNLATVLFCFNNFVKTIWWWVGLLIAIAFCIGCDVLCRLVKPLEQKVCICLGFIYISILIPFVVFYCSGVYIGTIVCLCACLFMLVYEVLEVKYGKAFEKFMEYAGAVSNVEEIENSGENKQNKAQAGSISNNENQQKFPAANKKTSVLVCSIKHYDEITKEFESEEASLVLFNRYYDLITKTVETLGGKEKSRNSGTEIFTFKADDENDATTMACKSALKIKSVVTKLNAKLIKEDVLGKEIEIVISVASVV